MRHIDSKDLALLCVKAAIEKKANHNLVYEIGKMGAFTDYFLITSGANERQVRAITDEIYRMTKDTTIKAPRIEGYDEGRWVLIDFGDVVVHVFQDHIREFYDLESLWAEAPRLRIPAEFYTSAPMQNLASHG